MRNRLDNVRIVGGTNIKQFYCKSCRCASHILIKIDGVSYCDDCVPKGYREKLINVNQNGDRV